MNKNLRHGSTDRLLGIIAGVMVPILMAIVLASNWMPIVADNYRVVEEVRVRDSFTTIEGDQWTNLYLNN